jgi:hypothetical protein
MKKLILFSTLSLFAGFSIAQTYLVQVRPVGSKLWKYANLKGEIVIDCEYPKTYPFSSDGFAIAYFPKKNLYVIINTRGEEIATEIQHFCVKDIYGYGAKGYSDGLIAVMIKDKWGYMDTCGKVAVPLKYDFVTEFGDGCGIVRSGDQYNVVDRYGNVTPLKEQPIAEMKQFTCNLAPFKSKNDLWGYLNSSGEAAISPQYSAVGYFSDGIAWVRSVNYLFGLINEKGEWVVRPEFDDIKQFDSESDLARAKKGEASGYVNKQGEFFTFNISEISDDFHEGLARGRRGGLFGFYNSKGEWVIEPRFEGARDFSNGYAGVKSGGLWGIIDKKGNWIVKPAFLGITDVSAIK